REAVKMPNRNRAGELALPLNKLRTLVAKRAVTRDDERVNGTSAKATGAFNANLCDAVLGGRDLIVTPGLAIVAQLVACVLAVVVGNLASESKQTAGDENRNHQPFHSGAL